MMCDLESFSDKGVSIYPSNLLPSPGTTAMVDTH